MMIFSSMKNESFDVNYARSDYLSSQAATLPRQKTYCKNKNFRSWSISILSYDSTTPLALCTEKKACKETFTKNFINLPRNYKIFLKSNPSTFIPHKIWIIENLRTIVIFEKKLC